VGKGGAKRLNAGEVARGVPGERTADDSPLGSVCFRLDRCGVFSLSFLVARPEVDT